MPDKPFVINDRRKFTAEGEARPDADRGLEPAATVAAADSPAETGPGRSTEESAKPLREPLAFPTSSTHTPSPELDRSENEPEDESDDESRGAARTHETLSFPSASQPGEPQADGELEPPAYDDPSLPPLTPEQIDQAARAYRATVERLDTALRANNLGSEPLPEMTFERLVQSLYMQALLQLGGAAQPGQAPQVDLLGARQTIDMLVLVADRSAGNLSETEDKFMQSALFELRMGFLEMTQALARQAATRQPAGVGPGNGKGPGIVR